ncbi:MAG: enoyl-CoA hydratase [Pseudomonadota bacterium]|jgi:enoyl-CoA hydratase
MLNYDVADGIAVITLNRPEAMNALSKALRAALAEALVKADADPEVSVIILTGAGERAFTAGLDLKELGGDPAAMADANAASPSANPVKAIEQAKKPVIGAINGVAVTGGFEVALACDILIASENARFADTHARVGILPGWGLSQKLSRLIGIYRAKELSFSGNYLDAKTAEAWGLVNKVVPAAELMTAAKKLAADIATIPSDTVQTYKALIDDGFAMDFGESLKLETITTSKLNAQVTPESIEQRRLAIQARGRSQA